MPSRRRILLVNDDEDSLFLLGRSVGRALPAAEVALLRDGAAALDYIAKHHVDAIVTDCTMPHVDGLTLVRKVRETNPTIPILMVTNSTHLAQQADKAGVTSYLPCARWNDVGAELAKHL